jgi:transcriptional regulator GlxA family with amidase domain
MKKTIALLIFDDVEVLDFAGPFEVFSVADERHDHKLFEITVVAKANKPVTARNGLSVNPHRTINEVSQADMLIVPGGLGTRPLIHDREVVDWVRQVGESATHVMSVCSGALVLAKAGLLHGLKATTHQGALKLLAELAPDTEVIPDVRFTDNGKVLTSAGISAGIDMSLHMVEKLHGSAVADATATYMEYRRS